MTVRVVTDSSCDLPDELARKHQIEVVPLKIRFGSDELVDRRDLTPKEFWARCAGSPVLPQTAAPAPGDFEVAFRRAADEGASGVACVVISSKLSATGQAAHAAAQSVASDIPVKVVDSRSVTLGLGMMALEAARRGEAGAALDDVVAVCDDLAGRTRVIGALDTLENLKKGGRIGAAKALLGSMLSFKPIIEVLEGEVEPGPRQRTRSRALSYLVDRVAAEAGDGAARIENLAVLHGDAPDVDQFVAMLAAHYPKDEIVVGDLGAVVGAHAGPRTIGVAYQVAK